MRLLVSLGTIALLSMSQALADSGPGFDCTGVVTPVEQMICSDPALSKKDLAMSNAYVELRSSLRHVTFDEGLVHDQVKWLKARATDCKIKKGSQKPEGGRRKAVECLTEVYDRRIIALQKAKEYEVLYPDSKNPPGTLKILGKWIPGRAAFGSDPWFYCTLTIDEGRMLFRGDLVGDELTPINYSMVEHTASHAILRVGKGQNACVEIKETEYWRFDSRDLEACQQNFIKANGSLSGAMCPPRPYAVYKSLSEAREHAPSAHLPGYWWYWE